MNNTDPRRFNFTEQTAAHNFQTQLANATGDEPGTGKKIPLNYTSWQNYAARTGETPWQLGWDVDDITLALRKGYSPYGIQQLEQEAQKRGLRIGPNATKRLNELRSQQPEAFKAPINYGALGGYGFDTSDIKAMWGTGPADDKGVAYGMTSPEWTAGLDKVRAAWHWAQDQNLPNSSGVDTWMQQKESQQRTAIEAEYRTELLEQQRAAAEEQARIQEAAAAQAARVKSSSPTGVGSAASIKGSRLSITEGKGRKGTKQFSRPTEYLNTLGIGGGGATSRSSTVTL